jgi:hypothetical protein
MTWTTLPPLTLSAEDVRFELEQWSRRNPHEAFADLIDGEVVVTDGLTGDQIARHATLDDFEQWYSKIDAGTLLWPGEEG